MGSHCDLEQIVEKFEAPAGTRFDSSEVSFWHFCHLDVLDVVSFEHIANVEAIALNLIVQLLCTD